MPRIFISYRRADTAGYAGRLYEHLTTRHLKQDQLFMDIDSIPPGLDFVQVIEDAVGQCDAVLVLIGPHWESITDEKGNRRLDNPHDFVRLEISTALKRNIRVIPVLVGNARMPSPNLLPDDLQPLVRRNAVQIDDKRFKYDVDSLARSLREIPSSQAGTAPQREPLPDLSAAIRERLPRRISAPETASTENHIIAWVKWLGGLFILGFALSLLLSYFGYRVWLLLAIIISLVALRTRPVSVLVALSGIVALHFLVLVMFSFGVLRYGIAGMDFILIGLHLVLGGVVAYWSTKQRRNMEHAQPGSG